MIYPKGLCATIKKKNSLTRFRNCIVILIFLFTSFTNFASHIVGGEMSYRCLGNNEYEISLTVYRDCYNATAGADFDPLASIGIFDANNNLVTSLGGVDSGQLLIPQTVPDTLEIILTDPCLTAPGNTCVEYMTYVDTVTLTLISGGYQLVYQRCCRNAAISNILNPDTTGMSIVAEITEAALTSCNSSPQFTIQPPVFVCVNEPFVFDQSLMDPDGDSLVYTLCTPLDGATLLDSRPQPPYSPPYNEILWFDPPYNLSNILGNISQPPLSIDAQTGVVTAFPETQGLYLVGICVEEYRNGVLISTTRREFQYTVGVCTPLEALIDVPEFQCGLEVVFENESENAEEFLWVFNDPGNPNATSTDVNPSFTFSDTGSYTVMLIADPNSPCTDTTYADITLVESTLEADFNYVTLHCTDSVMISLVDVSVDSAFMIDSWFWELSDGQTSNEQYPLLVVDSSQVLDVTLTVTSTNGCEETKEVSVPINLIPSNLLEDEIVLCNGDFVVLNPFAPVGLPFLYEWTPVDDLNDPTLPSPTASPTEATEYFLLIEDTLNNCFAELNTTVNILDNPSLNIEASGIFCGMETQLTAIIDVTQGDFIWSTDINFNNIISDSSTIVVSNFGQTTYYVEFSTSGACVVMDSISVQETSVNLSLVNSQFVCTGDQAVFTATNEDVLDTLTYTWFDNGGNVLGLDSQFSITPTQAGQEILFFQAENQHGCTYLDSVFLSVIDPSSMIDIQTSQSCNSNVISFSNSGSNSPFYEWIINLPSGNDTLQGATINYDFITPGTYEITLSPVADLPCALPSETIEVATGEAIINTDFSWDYINCQEELIIQFNDNSSAIQGNINAWFWTIGNTATQIGPTPIVTLTSGGIVEVELVVMTDEGCTDTLIQEIDFQLTDIGAFENVAVACDENGVGLNPLGNPSLNYQWSNTNFLDDANSVSPFANPPTTTTFMVTITDPNNPNCEIVQSVQVVVPQEELQAAFTYDIVNCDSTNVVLTFSDNSTPSGNITNWFWQFSTNQTNENPVTTIVANDGDILGVTFQVQSADGCTSIIQDTIHVETFTFVLPESEIIKCTGLPVNLNDGGNPNFTYSWLPVGSLNDPQSANPIANPVETTEYCVIVSNGDCSQESCVTVVVPETPLMANFSYNVSDCIDEAVINFTDQSQVGLGNIIAWNWTFSDGTTSNLENPSVTVNQSTTLEATLEVITSDGCEANFSQEVTINLLSIQIPNQVVLCEGDPIQLNPGGNPNHQYTWSPSAGLTNTNVASPFAFPISSTSYAVTVSDGDCELVQTVLVVVPDVPLTSAFSFNIEDCTDVAIIDFEDQSEYSPGNIVEWNWQFSNGDSSNLANPSLTIDQSQTLIVTLEVLTDDGCTDIVTQSLDVSLIDINVPSSLINCNGIGVELNPAGDPTYIYSWSPGTGLSNTNSPNPTANPTANTIYTVTVTDGNCEITRDVEVQVPDEPIEAGFTYNFDDCTDNAVIEFTDTTLIGNTTITDWQWSFTGNNTFTSDLQNPVITLNQSDTIIAELTVTTADGCEATVSQEIEVNLIDINISGTIIYCNTSGITLNPNGNPAYEYQWSPATGLSDPNVASPVVTGITGTTEYSVIVTFGNCTLTRNVEILVPNIQLEAGFDFNYLTCIDSALVQFSDATLYSGNIIEWDWIVNSQVSNEENPIFTFYETQSFDVQLIVTTDNGCLDTINNMNFVSLMNNINLPSDTATCNGNGIYLNPNSNNPGVDYQWSPGIGLSGDTLIANPFANPNSSQVYTVTLTSPETGCVEERIISLNVPTQPLTAGFEWEYSNCSDSAVVEFIDTSSYSGIISDWSWTFDNGGELTEQNPDSVFFNTDTLAVQLIVTSNDGCIDSIETLVPIEVIQIAAIEDTITLCNNESVFLNPNGNPNLFYTWSPGASLDTTNFYNPLATPSASTKYFVTITSPNNIACNEIRTIDVFVPTSPLDLNWTYPQDTIICTPVLALTAQSNNAAQYVWSDQSDFQNVLGIEAEFNAIPTNVGTYYLQVIDSVGCTLSDSITITSQAILAELESSVSICYGESTQVEVIVNPLSGGADIEYTWMPQEGILMGDDTGTPLFSPEDSVQYTLLMENQFGCIYEDTIDVNVLDLASLIEVGIEKDSINAGDEVQLIATQNANWIYSWEPCEGLSACDISNPIATPEESTTYTVLIEDETLGCIYEDSVSVFVFDQSRCQEPFVFVPKGFTPNDDGLNDILYVRGNYIEEMHFVVFNRWGERVFETKDISEGWDGKVNGKVVPPDVFGYYVTLKCFGGEEYLMKGNVTLIR